MGGGRGGWRWRERGMGNAILETASMICKCLTFFEKLDQKIVIILILLYKNMLGVPTGVL